MSTDTIKVGTRNDLTEPASYLDAQASAVLRVQGINGIGGWVFDIPTGENVDLSSDITEHYTESGSFIEDNIVNKPIVITLTGYKGELVYTPPKIGTFQGDIRKLTSTLSAVGAYIGPLTPGAVQKAAQISAQVQYAAAVATDFANNSSNLVKYFYGADTGKNLQQQAFAQLSALWNSKQILTVQTPWSFFQNMAIQAVGFKQNDTQNDYSEISVTLKEMRIVDVQTTTFDAGTYKAAIDAQQAPAKANGPTQGREGCSDSGYLQAGHAVGFVPKTYTNCP